MTSKQSQRPPPPDETPFCLTRPERCLSGGERRGINFIFIYLTICVQINLVGELCNLFFKLVFSQNKTMQQKESPFLEKFKQEKELRQLQMQLEDKIHELQGKQAKIIELENFISHVHNTSNIKDKFKEDETQCSFDEESIKEQADLIKRLGEVLNARQQQGMGLHLASREIEEENANLKLTLQKKDEEIVQLRDQLSAIEGYLQIGMKDLEFLCNQNRELKEQILQLQNHQSARADRQSQVEALKKSLELTRSQKGMLQQQLKTEEQKSDQLKQEIERLRNELEMQVGELQQAKGAMNSYDWKLFCIETQLDLLAKEKKQLKFLNEKLELRIAETQVTLKQQRTAVFSSEEEIRLLESQNRYLRADSDRKQEKIEKLLIQLDILKQDLEEQDQMKELEYRLKEKDEELNEIALYLKQKIGELDQAKHRSASMDKRIHELELAVEKKQHQNYELEQTITQNQQLLQKQSVKIDELQRNLQKTNKILEDNTILSLLRASQWNQLRSQLESTIESQEKKINELSVEIIERDISAHKKAEKLSKVEEELQKIQEDLLQMYTKFSETEVKVATLNLQKQKLGEEIQKKCLQNKQLCLKLFDQQTYSNMLEDQLKVEKSEKQRSKQISELLSTELQSKFQEVTRLKQKVMQQNETQLYYEQTVKQLKTQIELLTQRNAQYESLKKEKEITIQNMRREARQLNQLTQLRIQQMAEVISKEVELIYEANEQTTKFELMDEDEQAFEVMECRQQKQKSELKAKIEQYKSEVVSLMKVFD